MKTTIPLVLVALMLAGCAVDQQKEISLYRRVLDQDTTPVHFDPAQPLSLQDALLLANRHNESLGLRGEEYLRALIAKDRAAAAFLPTISLAPTYFNQEKRSTTSTRVDDDDEPGAGGGGGGGPSQQRDRRFDAPAKLEANLFNGFSDAASYRSAARTIEQRRALLLDAQASVLIDVARAYYQVLRSERSVEVLKSSLALQDERVRDMRGRQRAGVARPLDAAQTEAQASATRVALLAAQNDVRNGRSVLALLTGVPVGDTPLIDEADAVIETLAFDVLQTRAQRARQDLAAARAAIEAARQNVQAAIGRYYPSVSLDVSYFLYRESTPSESDWNYTLSANIPLFSAGLIHADVRTAWSLVREAMLFESLTRRQVISDVEIAHQNLQASRQRLAELNIQVAAAEEALRQADQSYRAGLATNLERLTAQDALLSAQLQLTSERYDRKVFELNLLRATGELTTRLPGEPQPATRPSTRPTTRPVPTT